MLGELGDREMAELIPLFQAGLHQLLNGRFHLLGCLLLAQLLLGVDLPHLLAVHGNRVEGALFIGLGQLLLDLEQLALEPPDLAFVLLQLLLLASLVPQLLSETPSLLDYLRFCLLRLQPLLLSLFPFW